MSQTLSTRRLAILAAMLPLLAVTGVFSLSRVFYVRDLTNWFLPHHEWFRRTIAEGQLPIWNPYLGGGYPTVVEPALQTFFPLTLPLRFLPGVLGWNLIVALPVAVAGLGTFIMLRRACSPVAAALGGIVFAASGPMLSTGSMPNLSWSCALMPWVLAAAEALAAAWSVRRVAVLSAAFALAILAGEPVTFLATATLAIAVVLVRGGTRRPRLALSTGGALVWGGLLAAIQVLPTAAIAGSSIRTTGALRNTWALHPARLAETVVPFAFGRATGYPHEITQWLFLLNDRHEPLLASVYLGVLALLLALAGARRFGRDRGATFWTVTAIASLAAAMGSSTTVALLRYPSKYVVVTAFAVAALAAMGWDSLGEARNRRVAIGAGALLAACGLVLWIAPPATSMAARWAAAIGAPDPAAAARSLLAAMTSAGPRLAALGALGASLVAFSHRPPVRVLLFTMVAIDLVAAGAPINPTIARDVLAPFDWVRTVLEHPGDRVFVARDFLGEGRANEDIAPPVVYPADRPVVAYQAVYDTALGGDLSASAVPLTLSREVSGLRPREYVWLLERFTAADRAMRYRFLSWTGTRFVLAMTPPDGAAVRRATLPVGSLALFEVPPAGARAFVASRIEVEPDTHRQIDRLFEPGFDPFSTVLLERDPGAPLPGAPSRARIRKSHSNEVAIDVDGPGGLLVLLDNFDRGWSATVDNAAAPVLRADGAYRAVRVPSGSHSVVFRYRPRGLLTGSLVSGLALAVLAAALFRKIGPRSRVGPEQSL